MSKIYLVSISKLRNSREVREMQRKTQVYCNPSTKRRKCGLNAAHLYYCAPLVIVEVDQLLQSLLSRSHSSPVWR